MLPPFAYLSGVASPENKTLKFSYFGNGCFGCSKKRKVESCNTFSFFENTGNTRFQEKEQSIVFDARKVTSYEDDAGINIGLI